MPRKLGALFVAIALVSLVPHQALGGRGGGSHGGGGGGGFHGGGNAHAASPSVGHSPSFSSPRPAVTYHPAPAHRPPQQFHPQAAVHSERIENRGIAHEPVHVEHPGVEPRTEFHEHAALGVRPTIANRPFNNTHVGPTNIGVNHVAHVANHPNYGAWYHGDWHDHWDRPWNHYPRTWWGPNWWGWGAATAAAALTAPWEWGYWGYSNPYYAEPVVVAGTPVVDYSQPLLLAGGGAAPEQTAEDQAMRIFQQARDSFQGGDYPTALIRINQALAVLPSDPVLNEFRALVLFAQGNYHEAAATLYAVLSVGPGWDWTTMSGMYADADVYTRQLRALEKYTRENPNSADARFVLAYQYLTCGHTDPAAAELRNVVRLNPKDQLSAQLLASLSPPAVADQAAADQAAPPEQPVPQPPAEPVSAAALAGNWTATRPDGGSVSLDLTADQKFKWTYNDNGKAHDFAGTYDVADNLLILKQQNNPTMVGQVTPLGEREFNFKMAGASPSDAGLTFQR